MKKYIFFNGRYYPEDTKLISILDRGLCFGDGLFEVIRCISGKFLLFNKHLNRMKESAQFLEMFISYHNDELLSTAKKLSQKNNIIDGELYIELTRGEAPRYHCFPKQIKPNFFMALNPLRKMPDNCWINGVSVCTFKDTRGGYCNLKTINLLPNILGKEKAKKTKSYEALFFRENSAGKYITEGPSSSFFGIKNNIFYTPELDNILPGTTRATVIDLALKNKFKVVEKRVYLEEYLNMDEAFLTSTVSKVMPVVKIDENRIGNGYPGNLTLKIQSIYEEFMTKHLE